MTDDEGLSLRLAVDWCGSSVTVREITGLLRLDAAIRAVETDASDERQAGGPGVGGGVLPACRAVQAMHVGSYDTLGTMYETVKQRMREEGLNASDDIWEYYLSDQSTDPATWLTLVVWPVL